MFPRAEGTDELFLFIKLKINNKHEVFITDDVIINLQDFACLHVYICLCASNVDH